MSPSVLAGALAALTSILCAASPAAAARGNSAALPSVAVERRVLANGLTVLLHEDRSIPIVAVNIWYKVGSKDEQPGKTGFAHLFEHYMFEGSAHAAAGDYFKTIFGMGGETNATTSNDRTDYYAIVPAEGLEEILRLESDRMGFLRIDQAGLDKQRPIVQNEKRLGENKPYGGLEENLNDEAWDDGHPYKHTIIGSMQDLDAAALSDVRTFHDRYYLPNNAIIVVSGDHDSAKTLALIEKWFGGLPAGATPPAPPRPRTAPLTARRERVVEDDKAQLPMALLAYRIPGKGKPGWLEASVAASILGGGRASRLTQKLQKEKRLVVQVQAEVEELHEDDLLVISAIPSAGVSVAAVEAAIRAEIDALAEKGPTSREMARAKAALRTATINAMQEADNLATTLAEGEAIAGDSGAAEARLRAVVAMPRSGPRDAARRYLRPESTSALTIVPKGTRP